MDDYQTFNVKDIPTKSVTLSLNRAHVVREIDDIVLQPGTNSIEIYGLAKSIEEQSVQVDGKCDGAFAGLGVTITDMTVDRVVNTEVMSDMDDSESEDEEDIDTSQSAHKDSDDESPQVRTLSEEIRDLKTKLARAQELEKSAAQRCNFLDRHAESMTCTAAVEAFTSELNIESFLSTYESERTKLFDQNSKATTDMRELKKAIARKNSEREAKLKLEIRQREKEKKKERKEKAKVRAAKAEKKQKTAEKRKEMAKFWPHFVYRIRLKLETSSNTPGSSRRHSIDGATLSDFAPSHSSESKKADNVETSMPQTRATLTISYITDDAWWTPRYDINISSVDKTAIIVYRAEFCNHTSETWKDSKIILSTSQTAYSGLDDKPPILVPWFVRLGGKVGETKPDIGGLMSNQETGQRHASHRKIQEKKAILAQAKFANSNNAPLNNLFISNGNMNGFPNSNVGPQSLFGASQAQQASMPQAQQLQQETFPPPPIQAMQATGFAGYTQMQSGVGGVGPSGEFLFGGAAPGAIPDDGIPGEPQSIDFSSSDWEDNGLTANYELPGTRTLEPSSHPRRHKVTSLVARDVILSHTCTPKLRPAALLRARLRNPSGSVTLLRGDAGISIDGTFLGTIALSRVAPGAPFSLPLGADPGVHVSYPKPVVKRQGSGAGVLSFGKSEQVVRFERTVTIKNVRQAALDMIMYDQVPVSQDEKLSVEVLTPPGLKKGDKVATGEGFAAMKKWGSATAWLKEMGEVQWDVKIEKGKSAVFKLEYAVRLPAGESIALP